MLGRLDWAQENTNWLQFDMHHQPLFLVDFMLGRLARRLRAIGYDAKYVGFSDDRELSLVSLRENRVILTRHSKISPRKSWKLIFIKSNNPDEQLKQVVETLKLELKKDELFSVCSICNAAVLPVGKESVKSKVPGYVYKTLDEFSACPSCGRIYWRGTHYDLLLKHLGRIGLKV